MIKLEISKDIASYNFDQIYKESLIDYDMKIEKPEPILRLPEEIGNKMTNVLTRGNLSLIKGGSKSRKSFGITMLTHLILNQNVQNDVVIFDTEQFSFHSLMNIKRLEKMNDKYRSVKLYNLRKYKKDIRFDFAKEYIEKYKPTLVFIDNVRDIISNFNDINQADVVVTSLAQLSEITGTHITSILHTNKGDTNARGHLGAELEQKAETVFFVETTDNITYVSGAYTRNKPFQSIQFTVDDEGLPRTIEDIPSNFSNKNPF